jgi:hypothetical protein
MTISASFRQSLLCFVGLAFALLLVLMIDFSRRTAHNYAADELPELAVVFTGQFNRLHMGLDLLRTDRVNHQKS